MKGIDAMQQKTPRTEFDLPQAQFALVQTVKQRMGLVASSSLTCFLHGEIPRLMGLSECEVASVKDYALLAGVTLPNERSFGGLN